MPYVGRDGRVHSHSPSYAHTLQLGNRAQQTRPVDDFPAPIIRKEIKEEQPVEKNDASLLDPKTFKESYFNVTYSNWEWRNWDYEGVLIAVSTDKPVYKPGDTLEARAYFFNYTDKAPVECTQFNANMEIIDSNENVIYSKAADYQEK